MIIDTTLVQGTPEWLVARLGVVTASCLGDVVTGSTCKPASGQRAYAYRLAAETITGEPLDGYESLAMFQGRANEPEARAAYSLITGHDVVEVGFIYKDESKRVGCSPDGLICAGDDYIGGVEIKNVMPHTQVEYIYSGGVPAKYRPQVYGSLYISGLAWWDFISRAPGLPEHLFRVTCGDEDYLRYAEALDAELPKFLTLLDSIIERVRG